ncbi:hypothetical protein BU15DRAFT_33814, partial [Melanogaster broomeanus]
LKTVVRCLPPKPAEDVFWQGVQAWVTDENVLGRCFILERFEGAYPLAPYIAFKNEEQVATFSRKYDG